MKVRGHDFKLTEIEKACGVTGQSVTTALAGAAPRRTATGGIHLE